MIGVEQFERDYYYYYYYYYGLESLQICTFCLLQFWWLSLDSPFLFFLWKSDMVSRNDCEVHLSDLTFE
ncbi:hypothetical protein L6452_08416 [Arctium lappa]|uniref:Uncharacterized protein n=1 Tax=Arctium lappa TaxID=4217 RepID=A0ACB9DHQ5_ARCLA|nr:hypothetical protein L6452_08416 [Arctium lappa]